MLGLIIPRPRIEMIINGMSSCDRRHFSTRKRGRVALIDPAGPAIMGFADLTECVPVSYDEYREHHPGEVTADMWAQHRTYYELRFSNIKRIEPPIPVDIGDSTVWAEIPDNSESGMTQSSLSKWF